MEGWDGQPLAHHPGICSKHGQRLGQIVNAFHLMFSLGRTNDNGVEVNHVLGRGELMPNEKERSFKDQKGVGREHAGWQPTVASGDSANEIFAMHAMHAAQRSGDGIMRGPMRGGRKQDGFIPESPSGKPATVMLIITCGFQPVPPMEEHSGQQGSGSLSFGVCSCTRGGRVAKCAANL